MCRSDLRGFGITLTGLAISLFPHPTSLWMAAQSTTEMQSTKLYCNRKSLAQTKTVFSRASKRNEITSLVDKNWTTSSHANENRKILTHTRDAAKNDGMYEDV